MAPIFSLIVPTRGRAAMFQRLLDSLADTAEWPEAVEVVAVIDADDPDSVQVACDRLILKQVVVPPGMTMGALNMAGYEAATGRYFMLLNDDVMARTAGWDTKIAACFAAFPDEMVLVHVNDTVFQTELCTFPVVSRKFCEFAGGICPREYQRYRIDDHVEDVFNLLGVLGERRILYLPEVVFEHFNHVTNEAGVRQYFSEPATLAVDAAVFDQRFGERKELALQLKSHIKGKCAPQNLARWRAKLALVTDPFSLRWPERLRVLTNEDLVTSAAILRADGWWHGMRRRLRKRIRESGYRGLALSGARRLLRTLRLSSRKPM
jgi:hypothetical protein